ncbi:MAG: hypothetical protein HY602_00550 [Parcubacteria group bacterium]|nr:hypothetical protein [Parcubacteria group bacterium]
MNEGKNSAFWSYTLVNLGIIGLVVFGIWFTHSLLALLGLLFMFGIKSGPKSIKTKCPKCDHEFTALDDEEDD